MAQDQQRNAHQEALVAEIIAALKNPNDQEFYRAVVDRLPEVQIRAVLHKIQTQPALKIGHPGTYFCKAMMKLAEARGIALPESIPTDCYVPSCRERRSHPEAEPLLCPAHWREFAAFKPEELYDEAGVVGYTYDGREPWLRALSYEDWRMYVFIHEKEFQALLNDSSFDTYLPPEE
jgi:hypothetical protein